MASQWATTSNSGPNDSQAPEDFGIEEYFYQKNSAIRHYLAKGGDVNAKSWMGRTLLHHYSSEGKIGVVRLLIEHGARINARSSWGVTALHEACWSGWLAVIHLLLASGARSDAWTHNGLSVAHCATLNHTDLRAAKILKYLADCGIPIDAPNCHKLTPLHYAIALKEIKAAGVLLDYGANPTRRAKKHSELLCALAAVIGDKSPSAIDLCEAQLTTCHNLRLKRSWTRLLRRLKSHSVK